VVKDWEDFHVRPAPRYSMAPGQWISVLPPSLRETSVISV
jgi:hypothetical protein